MDSAVPSADAQTSASATNVAGEDEDYDDEDAEALKAHIAKMKAGGDSTAGNGEQLAKSVKCSEVSLSFCGFFAIEAVFMCLPISDGRVLYSAERSSRMRISLASMPKSRDTRILKNLPKR